MSGRVLTLQMIDRLAGMADTCTSNKAPIDIEIARRDLEEQRSKELPAEQILHSGKSLCLSPASVTCNLWD